MGKCLRRVTKKHLAFSVFQANSLASRERVDVLDPSDLRPPPRARGGVGGASGYVVGIFEKLFP